MTITHRADLIGLTATAMVVALGFASTTYLVWRAATK